MYTHEIAESKTLKIGLGALTFSYFYAFADFLSKDTFTRQALEENRILCPPYFQNCDWAYVLETLPHGYSQPILYAFLFGILTYIVYCFVEQKWGRAQKLLIIPFVWHLLVVAVLSYSHINNYELYIVYFGVILLFLPHKEFFMKLSLVSFYFISTTTKIYPSWVAGSYFTNLQNGLPIFPDWSIPIFTNLVIVMEMVGAWLLLRKPGWLQKSAFTFFCIFHVYSVTLVYYRYPSAVLPMLIAFFGPWYTRTPVPLDKKAISGWVLVTFYFFAQAIPLLVIQSDVKLTLEGNRYGQFMFEANHQCISRQTTYPKVGEPEEQIDVHGTSRFRCNPYYWWFRSNQVCKYSQNLESISWTFDHSVNGGPFLRIVDTNNVCNLEYAPFRHNEWIKDFSDKPEVIGWPVKNSYW